MGIGCRRRSRTRMSSFCSCAKVHYYKTSVLKIKGRFGKVPRMSVKANVSRWTLQRRDKATREMMVRRYGTEEEAQKAILRGIKTDKELSRLIENAEFKKSVERLNKNIRALEMCPIAVTVTLLFAFIFTFHLLILQALLAAVL